MRVRPQKQAGSHFGIVILVLSLAGAATASAAWSVRQELPPQVDEFGVVEQLFFGALDARLHAVGEGVVRSPKRWDCYQLSEAPARLAFASDDRAQRDVTGAVSAASHLATLLVQTTEQRDSVLGLDTPPVVDTRRFRDDLWQRSEALKHTSAIRRGEAGLAEHEVELVQAGHAQQMLGWRHARPYLQAFERLAQDADVRATGCPTETLMRVTVDTPRLVEIETAPETPYHLDVARAVHFAFAEDKLGLLSNRFLETVASVLLQNPVASIDLRGHTGARGNSPYNREFPQGRADHVKRYIIQSGVGAVRIDTRGEGSTDLVSRGNRRTDHARNRRGHLRIDPYPQGTAVSINGDHYLETGRRRKKTPHK